MWHSIGLDINWWPKMEKEKVCSILNNKMSSKFLNFLLFFPSFRRLMDPAFTLKRLSTYLTRFYKVADSLVRQIGSELDKSDSPSLIDMHAIGSPYTIG